MKKFIITFLFIILFTPNVHSRENYTYQPLNTLNNQNVKITACQELSSLYNNITPEFYMKLQEEDARIKNSYNAPNNWDPIRKAHIAASVGMTPEEVFGPSNSQPPPKTRLDILNEMIYYLKQRCEYERYTNNY